MYSSFVIWTNSTNTVTDKCTIGFYMLRAYVSLHPRFWQSQHQYEGDWFGIFNKHRYNRSTLVAKCFQCIHLSAMPIGPGVSHVHHSCLLLTVKVQKRLISHNVFLWKWTQVLLWKSDIPHLTMCAVNCVVLRPWHSLNWKCLKYKRTQDRHPNVMAFWATPHVIRFDL